MKQLFYILPLLVLFSCGKADRVRIYGEIEEGQGKKIYLDKLEVNGSRAMDSVKIGKAGRFSFSLKVPEPAFYNLRIDHRNFITLLTEPGENIGIEARASSLPGTYRVTGSDGSELLKKLNDRLEVTRGQIISLIDELDALEDDAGSEDELARINEELGEIIKAQRNFSIAFILENRESLAAITALYQQTDEENYVLNRVRDIQYLKIVSESLMKKYPNSPHVKALATDAENQLMRYELHRLSAMAEERGEVVTTYSDIAMPGIDGDTIRLYSLQEKYILLFFGSSLNQASVQLSQELLPVYKAYHNKGFEIYQVSVERDRDEWVRSIKFHELPWVHVAETGQGRFLAAQLYNVQEIPSTYLINRDIGVIERNVTAAGLRQRLSRALD
jgi:hypothetical protein